MIGLANRILEAPGLLADAWRRARGEVLVVDAGGWLRGRGVVRVPAHPSWYYHHLRTDSGWPIGIMAHYTATAPGTARTMARRRRDRRDPDFDRAASWHVTVGNDGRLWQMVPLTSGAWHCGRGGVEDVDGGRVPINRAVIGVELEGHGAAFPETQVAGACRLWRAIVAAYGVPRAHAMLEHSTFDPQRRRDPGPVWMREHAPRVIAAAYPGRPAA